MNQHSCTHDRPAKFVVLPKFLGPIDRKERWRRSVSIWRSSAEPRTVQTRSQDVRIEYGERGDFRRFAEGLKVLFHKLTREVVLVYDRSCSDGLFIGTGLYRAELRRTELELSGPRLKPFRLVNIQCHLDASFNSAFKRT